MPVLAKQSVMEVWPIRFGAKATAIKATAIVRAEGSLHHHGALGSLIRGS
jgi:hypothetical protein